MATGIYDIVGRVGSVVEVESAVTSGMMATMVENHAINVTNITGRSIDVTNIGSAFFPVLTDLTAMSVVSKQTGIGADFDYRIADVSISKGGRNPAATQQITVFANNAKSDLSALGVKINMGKTVPAV